MDLSPIVAQLEAETASLNHIVLSSPVDSRSDVDAEKELTSILASAYPGGVWPVNAGMEPATPTIVYRLAGTADVAIDGYPLAFVEHRTLPAAHASERRQMTAVIRENGAERTIEGRGNGPIDAFVDALEVVVRSGTYADVITAVAAIRTAIDASAWGVQIADEADGEFNLDLTLNQKTLDVQFITPALPGVSSDLTPSAVVYPLSDDAEESNYDSCTKQLITTQFGVAIMTTEGNIEALRDEVFAAIHGWVPATGYHPVEYVRGEAAGRIGGLEVWRDLFRTAHYMRNGA